MSEKKPELLQLLEDLKPDILARDAFYKNLDYLNDEMDKRETPSGYRVVMLKTFFSGWEKALALNDAIDKDIENRGGNWLKRYENRDRLLRVE